VQWLSRCGLNLHFAWWLMRLSILLWTSWAYSSFIQLLLWFACFI
jgi:hypothetical protein